MQHARLSVVLEQSTHRNADGSPLGPVIKDLPGTAFRPDRKCRASGWPRDARTDG